MVEETEGQPYFPHGSVEPHAGLLKLPGDGQSLYKVMSVENFLSSISGKYLYFNRIDSYKDFKGADAADGQQLPADQPGNAKSTFIKAPDFSVADYYNRCRARTYASCFSLDNSDYIWREYGNGGTRGKVGLVVSFAKLREALNKTLHPENAALMCNGVRYQQMFSINYGLVEYIDWQTHRANDERLPNPIQYTHFKDLRFQNERELRVSLSAMGMGQFVIAGKPLPFPPSLQFSFDFRGAMANGVIERIEHSSDCDTQFLTDELLKFRIQGKQALAQARSAKA